MFSIDVVFEGDLNKCFISVKLKDIFKTEGVSFSGNAKVTKEKKEEIKGGVIDGKKRYMVKKEGGMLNIYKNAINS